MRRQPEDASVPFGRAVHTLGGKWHLCQVTLSKSVWTAPVSDNLVSVGFKQHIAAGDALRTGGYSRTLTFTLSTASP